MGRRVARIAVLIVAAFCFGYALQAASERDWNRDGQPTREAAVWVIAGLAAAWYSTKT